MSGRRGPRSTEDRLRRLLVMLPWLMEREQVPVAEVASRFEISEADVVRDLELVAMCGLPPFVDELIDVFVDEGVVFVGVPRLFTRPLRITAPEAVALVAACRSAMQLPGHRPDDALARAVAKLEAALADGAPTDGSPSAVVDVPRPAWLDEVTHAADEGRAVRLRYWSATSTEASERVIVPRRIVLDRGQWYVVADDRLSNSQRTFRVDRIENVELLDEYAPAAAATAEFDGRWFVGADLPVATLRLAPAAAWVIERYPSVAAETGPDGGCVARLPITSEEWLADLLVRLGPDATVLDPPEWGDLGRRAAAAILSRYADAGTAQSAS